MHKGLICWIPIPTAASVPIRRLLIKAMEAAFAYMFWAMNARLSDHCMAHICLWDEDTLEYDGLCSHSCLNERIIGDFNSTPEALEADALEREKKRLILKNQNNSNYHYKQMETNYDEYIGQSNLRVARSRAKNPGRDRKHQAERVKTALGNKSFHCELCNITFGTKQRLQKHEKSPKHKRKSQRADNPFICDICDLGSHNQSNLTRHNSTDRHQKKAAAAGSSVELD